MFTNGLRRGMPIALGYFPVAFSFGVLCVNSHMPLGMATLISVTNFTSSGQFAGLNLMLAQASYFEVALTLLMINARYFLMSLSLSQKIDRHMNALERMIVSFCISDETFALASLEVKPITFKWMSGFLLGPFLGWSLGALAGELVVGLLPSAIQGAMGIALYGMFIAIIVPASKHALSVAVVVLMASLVHIILTYVPFFQFMSAGFKLISATLIASFCGAKLFPREVSDNE